MNFVFNIRIMIVGFWTESGQCEERTLLLGRRIGICQLSVICNTELVAFCALGVFAGVSTVA